MALEITVGPSHLTINEGNAVLVCGQDGQIDFPSEKGLYFCDTRLISSWSIWADGVAWDLLSSGNPTHYASRIFLANRRIATETGAIPAQTVGLAIGRVLDGGMHEDLDLTNYGPSPARFNLEIAVRSDFADIFEVKAGSTVRRGKITTEWSADGAGLQSIYRNRDFCRGLAISVRRSGSPPVHANGRLSFEIELAPKASWHACLGYAFIDGDTRLEAPSECIDRCRHSRIGERVRAWRGNILKLSAENEPFERLYRQAVEDLATLRLPIRGTDDMNYVPAAGVPWFVALFGRDSLITSLQSLLVYPDFATATLDVLGANQATKWDDYRDAEPGKILHELRVGELAHRKAIPHTPYYGTADATALYLVVLHASWMASGDRDHLERLLPVAESCLDWIDRYGDQDGDGFQEYATRSTAGYENQGWKDAGEAVVDSAGNLVRGPKALCELQGYTYDAWLRMADIFEQIGRPERARELRAKARRLFERFNDAFWDEEAGFYAFALDGDKRQVTSITSNPGQCLWSGIVPPDRARRVVQRLMQPDMLSGWGIRTLSAGNPAFNPYSYQTGSVWPHDNSLIALGMRRYGCDREAGIVIHEVVRAGGHFDRYQMPELYAGVTRTPASFPVQYLGANVPQAWAAGSILAFLQAMLGFQPDAPHDRLHLDPCLPDWLPELSVADLRVGKRRYDIRLWRDGSASRFEVTRGDAGTVAYRSFATGPRLQRHEAQAAEALHRSDEVPSP